MVLPIYSYGHEILRTVCEPLTPETIPAALISDMWDTLYGAAGCGLAAPQVGESVQLFLVDSKLLYNQMNPESRAVYFEDNIGIKAVFINAVITAYSERRWVSEEACLSIPGLQYGIERPWSITIEYRDEYFQPHKRTFSGITARMILHEFEHTNGVLYLDHLPQRKQKRIAGKLDRISRGRVKADYPMSFTNDSR
ncbi:peptide deformylase [Terrimonas sp. NA20]|uniref:Peptide deformylase n=1 Tax=Terrimonas ginsenosidimutans TaxID=2908004 RepID=A0ABS9KMM7_9BACT|nr:peptide deformylase [Terrimonas ginsenosidimutans]MCG2613581.1 peptide deformylase [Terrimonas ginsenosidimutans]